MKDRLLRVGVIGSINTLPVYWGLREGLVDFPCRLVEGTPAQLNGMLRAGDLDVSAISSVEYSLAAGSYLALPDFSIAAKGKVGSVLFFMKRGAKDLDGRRVLLTENSATSCALLRVILQEVYEVRPSYSVGPAGDPGVFEDGYSGVLLIGDEALRLSARANGWRVMDLGLAWRRITGLPFVFGLWAARRSTLKDRPEELAAFHRALIESRSRGLERLDHIAGLAGPRVGLSTAECLNYFRGLTYSLGEKELKGLKTFFGYLERAGILKESPRVEFFGGRG